jgi:hypothetical protein
MKPNHGMNTSEITILTVNWHSSNLIKDLLDNLCAKAANPQSINFLIVDNTNGEDRQLHDRLSHDKSVTILLHAPGPLKGLYAHASGINWGFKHIHTKYFLLIDPDVYLFKKNWDTTFIKELTTHRIDAIGTAFPDWWLGTYHNFPSPIFCFAKTASLKSLKANWMPTELNKSVKIRNFMLRQILRCAFLLNRRILFKYEKLRRLSKFLESSLPICTLDTGHPLSIHASNDKIYSKTFTALFNDAVNPVSKLETEYKKACAELANQYELYYYQNEIILTHQYGSQNFLLRTPKGADRAHWKKLINQIDPPSPK